MPSGLWEQAEMIVLACLLANKSSKRTHLSGLRRRGEDIYFHPLCKSVQGEHVQISLPLLCRQRSHTIKQGG